MRNRWLIYNPDLGLFWSNEHGWAALASAEAFSQNERDTLRLPLGGEWLEQPERCHCGELLSQGVSTHYVGFGLGFFCSEDCELDRLDEFAEAESHFRHVHDSIEAFN